MKIEFIGDEGAVKFQLMHEGFMVGGALQNSKGMSVLRREIVILDKLEAISTPCECGRKLITGDDAREIACAHEPVILDLTLQELELIKQYFDSVPWKTGFARAVVLLSDWMERLLGT